ncbi:MAG: hypothetical protein PHW63_08570 [Alphaproteobacteria bacterium]|nr:hypothetical protein [Alphaproteobacteria bacterium]
MGEALPLRRGKEFKMANIDNHAQPLTQTLKADGIVKNNATVGSQAIDTGRGSYAISVEEPSTEAAPSEQKLDAPAPAPNLEALLTPDKDKHLDTVVEALQKGNKTKLFKLMPDEKEKVEAFNKNGKNSNERRKAIAKLLGEMRRKGTLAPHLKAAGVNKETTTHAHAVAQAADAPKPTAGTKRDPKTGHVISADKLKDIQAKSTVYIPQGGVIEEKLLKADGHTENVARLKTTNPFMKHGVYNGLKKDYAVWVAAQKDENLKAGMFKAGAVAAPLATLRNDLNYTMKR